LADKKGFVFASLEVLKNSFTLNSMNEAKLFSTALFLFFIFITVGFFQSLKQEKTGTIKMATTFELAATPTDEPHQSKPDGETKIVPTSLHTSVSIELTREILYLFEILLRNEGHFNHNDSNTPIPFFKFFRVLLNTVISPNAP
jgi:hypothetical protein